MSSLYEIVELADGEIVLRRAEDDTSDDESLVSIKFSEESIFFLGESRLAVARAMIEAGLDKVSELSEEVEAIQKSPIDKDSDSALFDEMLSDEALIVH